MARINVIVPDEMKEQAELIAEGQDRNLSWVVRKALEEYITRNEVKKEE